MSELSFTQGTSAGVVADRDAGARMSFTAGRASTHFAGDPPGGKRPQASAVFSSQKSSGLDLNGKAASRTTNDITFASLISGKRQSIVAPEKEAGSGLFAAGFRRAKNAIKFQDPEQTKVYRAVDVDVPDPGERYISDTSNTRAQANYLDEVEQGPISEHLDDDPTSGDVGGSPDELTATGLWLSSLAVASSAAGRRNKKDRPDVAFASRARTEKHQVGGRLWLRVLLIFCLAGCVAVYFFQNRDYLSAVKPTLRFNAAVSQSKLAIKNVSEGIKRARDKLVGEKGALMGESKVAPRAVFTGQDNTNKNPANKKNGVNAAVPPDQVPQAVHP